MSKSHKNLADLVEDMKKRLEAIIKRSKKSGVKVNGDKTELCLFLRSHQSNSTLNIYPVSIHSKSNMNVLGVSFDTKLNWTNHVLNAISKNQKGPLLGKTNKAQFKSKRIG